MGFSPLPKNLFQLDPLIVSLYLALFLVIFLFFHKKSGGKLKLPPSPPRLPIIGNLHQLGKFPHRSLQALSEKYGPMMFLNLGQVQTLVVSSPDVVADIVNNHDVVFSNRPRTTATDILLYGTKNISFAPYGEFWRQARKICVLELLSLKRVQSFQSVREEEVETLLTRVKQACPSGSTINLSDMLLKASNNIMARCILGQSYKAEDGSMSNLGELTQELTTGVFAFCVGDYLPCLRWIDVLRGFAGRLKKTFQKLDAFNDRVVEEHKAARKARGGRSETEDFVDVLLGIQEDGILDFELTQDHLKAIAQDMFGAGIDTSSIVLEWLMVELLRNPRAMKKAQEEVRRVVGLKTKLDANDINQMPYLNCVVKEALRLHPPAPLLIPRETTAGVKILGFDIPAKTRVLVNAWAIHMSLGSWERPEEFVPERFEGNRMDFNGQDFRFIPFGFGRRRCPGLAFGIAGIEYLVANLLCWFDWKLPEDYGEDLDMSEVYGITVHKKVPLHVVPMSYSS